MDIPLNFGKQYYYGISNIIKQDKEKALFCFKRGYQISKDKLPFMKSIDKRNAPKKVAQYDLEGNLIKIWDTVEAPFKKYGSGVKKCLKGAQNKTKGFVFKYVE